MHHFAYRRGTLHAEEVDLADLAGAVAGEHLDISEQMMAEGDGLGRLQMREARHHGGGLFVRLLRKRVL